MIQSRRFTFTIPTGAGPSGTSQTTPVIVNKVELPPRGFINDMYIRFSSAWFYAIALSDKDPADFQYLEYGGPYDILDEVGFTSVVNVAILSTNLYEMRLSHAMKSTTTNGWCTINEPYSVSNGLWLYAGPLVGVFAPVTVDVVIYASPLTTSVI